MEKNNNEFNPLDSGMGMTPFSQSPPSKETEKSNLMEIKDKKPSEFIPMGLTPFDNNNFNPISEPDKIIESEDDKILKCPECSEIMNSETDNKTIINCSNCEKRIDIRNRKSLENLDRSKYISESGLRLRGRINFKAVSYDITGRVRLRGDDGEIIDKWQIISKKGKKIWIEDKVERIYFLGKIESLKLDKEENLSIGDKIDFSGINYTVSKIRILEAEYIEGEIDTDLFAGDKIEIIELREGKKRILCEKSSHSADLNLLKQMPGGERTMYCPKKVDQQKETQQNTVKKKKKSTRTDFKNFFSIHDSFDSEEVKRLKEMFVLFVLFGLIFIFSGYQTSTNGIFMKETYAGSYVGEKNCIIESKIFKLDNSGGAYCFEIDADLQGYSTSANVSAYLINMDDEKNPVPMIEIIKEFWSDKGVDDGGYWTETDANVAKYFSISKAGKYRIRLYVNSEMPETGKNRVYASINSNVIDRIWMVYIGYLLLLTGIVTFFFNAQNL